MVGFKIYRSSGFHPWVFQRDGPGQTKTRVKHRRFGYVQIIHYRCIDVYFKVYLLYLLYNDICFCVLRLFLTIFVQKCTWVQANHDEFYPGSSTRARRFETQWRDRTPYFNRTSSPPPPFDGLLRRNSPARSRTPISLTFS